MKIIGKFLVITGVIISFLLGYLSWIKINEIQSYENWETTSAELINAKSNSHTTKGGSWYNTISISYSFVVEGEKFFGNRYDCIDIVSGDREFIADLIEKLSSQPFEVYFDRTNPELSCVRRPVADQLSILIFLLLPTVGLFQIGMGILVHRKSDALIQILKHFK
jgi:hypothetical protein